MFPEPPESHISVPISKNLTKYKKDLEEFINTYNQILGEKLQMEFNRFTVRSAELMVRGTINIYPTPVVEEDMICTTESSDSAQLTPIRSAVVKEVTKNVVTCQAGSSSNKIKIMKDVQKEIELINTPIPSPSIDVVPNMPKEIRIASYDGLPPYVVKLNPNQQLDTLLFSAQQLAIKILTAEKRFFRVSGSYNFEHCSYH